MADLPDWYTQVSEVEAEAYSIRGGADAAKSASPVAKNVYLATDTKKLYICIADGAWTGFDASILIQGIITLYADLAGGGYEIANIKDPTAAQSAATRAYVLAQVADYLALVGGTMSGAIAMGTNKITGLGDPAAAQDAATKTYIDTRVPSGLIVMWHGTIANIPSGWVICDGNNSTPNLLAKFVEGVATAATDPGATGGATAKTTVGHLHDEQGHWETAVGVARAAWSAALSSTTNTDSITDIRPSFYDVAFIMKT